MKDTLTGEDLFKCHACSPSMHGMSVDGNRKLYRFKNAARYVSATSFFFFNISCQISLYFFLQYYSMDKGLFSEIFIAKDEDVSGFVDHVQQKHRHVYIKFFATPCTYTLYASMSTFSIKIFFFFLILEPWKGGLWIFHFGCSKGGLQEVLIQN